MSLKSETTRYRVVSRGKAMRQGEAAHKHSTEITPERWKVSMPRLRKAVAVALVMLQSISIPMAPANAHTYGCACARPPTLTRLAGLIAIVKPIFAIAAVVFAELVARIGIADALEATEALIDRFSGSDPQQRLQAKYTFRLVIVWGIHHVTMNADEQMQLLTALSRLDGKIALMREQGPPSPQSPSFMKSPARAKEPAQQALFHAEVFRASKLKLHGDALPLRSRPDPMSAALVNIPAGDQDILWSGRSEDVTFWNRPEGGYELYLRVTYKRKVVGYVAAHYLEVIEESAGHN